MARSQYLRVRCTEEELDALTEIATAERRSRSDLLRLILEDYVANYRRRHPAPGDSSAYRLNETKDAAPPITPPIPATPPKSKRHRKH